MFNSYVIKLPEGNIKWTICRCQMMWLYWHYIPYSKLKHMNHLHILQLSWLLMPAESHLLSRTCWELDEVFIPIVLMKPPTCFHHRLIIIHQLHQPLLKTCFFLRITELTTSSRTQWGGNWWETWRVPNHPWRNWQIPSGKHTKNYGKSPFLMGKSTINGHFQ